MHRPFVWDPRKDEDREGRLGRRLVDRLVSARAPEVERLDLLPLRGSEDEGLPRQSLIKRDDLSFTDEDWLAAEARLDPQQRPLLQVHRELVFLACGAEAV